MQLEKLCFERLGFVFPPSEWAIAVNLGELDSRRPHSLPSWKSYMIIWLASYPRSGNTALRILLKNVFGLSTHSIYDDPLDIAVNPGVRKAVGHIDHGLDAAAFRTKAESSTETFLVKTHYLPVDSSKAIYVARDGRSAIVSYRHWLNRYVPGSNVTLHDVVIGKVDYVSWSAHIEAWAPQTRRDTLFLTYQDVINPTENTIAAIADFLGADPLVDRSIPSFNELKAREPGFFRAGSDSDNIAELAGNDLDLFWWLHGQTMMELGFVTELPHPPNPMNTRNAFLDHVERSKSELKNQATVIQKDLDAVHGELLLTNGKLSETENAMADEAGRLRNCLINLTNSNWLRLGHKLKVTRALRHIRSDLSSSPNEPSILPTKEVMTGEPEVVAFHAASTARALQRISKRDLSIETVIDVGASNGMWSEVTEKVLPNATYLLIEAQEFHREALEVYCRQHPNAAYVLAAAGDQNGEVFFDDRMPFGGVASKEQTSHAKKAVPMYSIDHLVESRGLSGPFLLKLDTHGFEVPILNGATETLKTANLVVIEVYNFRILDQSLIFDEMCAFMRERGFGVIDISEPLWRVRDGAFWQMDMFFVPLSREEFAFRSYE